MPKVYLAQLHCPASHCILALAASRVEEQADEQQFMLDLAQALKEGAKRAHREGKINSFCGICGAEAKQWAVSVGPTKYSSMAEAEPALREQERVQREAAERLHAARERAARQ